MLQTYQTFPFSRIIDREYFYLCNRTTLGTSIYEAPYIGDLIRETWQEADQLTIERSIQEAVGRKDYELYGMTRDVFLEKAWLGEVHGFYPEVVSARDIQNAVQMYLRARYISFTDYDGSIVNSPIGGSVW